MNTVLPSIKMLLTAILKPQPFFEKYKSKDLISPAVVGIGSILVVGMILLIGTAMIYFQEIVVARTSIVKYYSLKGVIPLVSNPSPWKFLSFPVVWAVVICLSAGVRYGAMKLFGDKKRHYITLVAVTVFAFTPMVLIAIIQGIGNNLFPFAEPIEKSNIIMIRSYGLMTVFTFGVLWEGFIFIKAGTLIFAQNTGRAVLTWLTPWFLLIVFYAMLRYING